MVGKVLSRLVYVLLIGALLSPIMASPVLPVTKGPVLPVPSYTGPTIDPHALRGQWFKDLATGCENPWQYEFYDNAYGYGGSAWKSTRAIEGYVNNVAFDGMGNITSFWINATIWNDSPYYSEWEEGSPGNSHGEWRTNAVPYVSDWEQVKLTTSFADDGTWGNFPGPAGVYSGSEASQNIYAMDYEELGWYCWTPNNSDPSKVPWGGYMVPTYDFGPIPIGGSATRNLPFGLYTPVGPGSPLYQFLHDAYYNQWDVFSNRTTSLKISQYFDSLAQDTGVPYPFPPYNSSDVSVFVPEPGTLLLAAFGGLVALRRGRP